MFAPQPNMTLSQLKPLLAASDAPELGPGPRAGIQPLPALQKRIDAALENSHLSSEAAQLIRGTILLWHDHLDASHEIVQESKTADGSYVHGIMHRREPDYGNAKYWFRRVGRHACFSSLAEQTRALCQTANQRQLQEKLLLRGEWDPFALIDTCEEVAGRSATDSRVRTLRAIQQAEFEILLDHFRQLPI